MARTLFSEQRELTQLLESSEEGAPRGRSTTADGTVQLCQVEPSKNFCKARNLA